MICGSVALMNEILEIFAPRMGVTVKMVVLKSFEEKGRIGLVAKFQLSQSPLSCFLSITTFFFLQIFDGNICRGISGQFFACLKQIRYVLIKFEQNLGLTFCNL